MIDATRMHHRIPRTWSCRLSVLLLAALAPAGTGAADRWPDEYQAGPFSCHADFPLARHRALLDSMPRLQRDLVAMLGIGLSREPMHLFLFQRKSTYEAYLRQYFPEVPSRKALFIKNHGPGMVFAYLGDDFETDLRHECTHALLNAALPVVPLWLDEGLAEYFEVPAEHRARENPHLSSVRWGARLGQVPALESLEAVRDLSAMNRTKYRQAWAWVHFMLHGPPEAHDELVRYLSDIQALTPPGVLSRRLQARVPHLDRRFAQHFKAW
jgi:hypothetical protein